MRAKQKQWETFFDMITAGYEKPGDVVTAIPFPPGLVKEMLPGRWRGVASSFPQLGIIDGLCWPDLAGIDPSSRPGAPGTLDTSGVIPPGVIPPGYRKGRLGDGGSDN